GFRKGPARFRSSARREAEGSHRCQSTGSPRYFDQGRSRADRRSGGCRGRGRGQRGSYCRQGGEEGKEIVVGCWYNQPLFLFLLLRLVGSSFLAALFLGLGSHRFGGRRDFFLDRNNVGYRLIGIGENLQLLVVRKIGNAQDLSENQVRDFRLNLAGNVAGQTLDFDFARNLLQNSTPLLDSDGLAFEHDGHHDRQLLVHSNALQVDVQQRSLDRLILPVNDHGLG